jgi:hypothetical protein
MDAVSIGAAVVVDGRPVGTVEEVIPEPDGVHIYRLIVRLAPPDGRFVRIPGEWLSSIDDQGRVVLWVGEEKLADLPEYVPPIPAEMLRTRVQQALDQHPTTTGSRIEVGVQGDTVELRGAVADAATRDAATQVATATPGVGQVRNLLDVERRDAASARTGSGP